MSNWHHYIGLLLTQRSKVLYAVKAKTAAHREERAELRTKVVEAHESGDYQAVQRALQAQQAHRAPPRQPRTEQETWIATEAFKVPLSMHNIGHQGRSFLFGVSQSCF